MADSIGNGDITTIGHCMAALNRLPGAVLPLAVLFFFRRMPADGGRIKNDFGALHGRQPRGFRIPLIPADQHPDFSVARLPRSKSEIARSEIKLFVVERVVGNMHFPIQSQHRAISINDGGAVVINSRGSLLEDRSNDHHFMLSREFLEGFGRWAGDRLGQAEEIVIFRLAKVLRTKQFLGADNLRALPRSALGEG